MKTTAKKGILSTPGIERGEIKIKGVRFGEVITFPFSTKEYDCGYPTIVLEQGNRYGTDSWINIYIKDNGLEMVTCITSPLDRGYNPLYLSTTFPWKDVSILWYMKNCNTESAEKVAA